MGSRSPSPVSLLPMICFVVEQAVVKEPKAQEMLVQYHYKWPLLEKALKAGKFANAGLKSRISEFVETEMNNQVEAKVKCGMGKLSQTTSTNSKMSQVKPAVVSPPKVVTNSINDSFGSTSVESCKGWTREICPSSSRPR